MKTHLLLVFYVIVLVSCQKDEESGPNCSGFEISFEKEYDLNSHWTLVAVQEKNRIWKEECAEASGCWISFLSDGKFTGNSSCNEIFGSYTSNPKTKSLSIESFAQTLRLCIETESKYWDGRFGFDLNSVDAYNIEGNKLTLSAGSKKKLIFRAYEENN